MIRNTTDKSDQLPISVTLSGDTRAAFNLIRDAMIAEDGEKRPTASLIVGTALQFIANRVVPGDGGPRLPALEDDDSRDQHRKEKSE